MRQSKFSQTTANTVSRQSVGDSNHKVLMAYAFRNASISGAREAYVEVLATAGDRVSYGAYGSLDRTFVLTCSRA